jgi:hydrogenase nickel incorporation protein HypB
MCENCGCISNLPDRRTSSTASEEDKLHHVHSHEHGHSHDHDHGTGHHHHFHPEVPSSKMELLRQNQIHAARNRGFFDAKNILAIKIVSSQGAGKTMLIEKSIERLINVHNIFVIEQNQITNIDAEKFRAAEAKTININTDGTHQLNAEMIYKAVKTLEIKDKSILFIENQANTPSSGGLTDLGEMCRVFVFSITEGDHKPVKYPELFSGIDTCIISKTDLLPYVDFDIEKAKKAILALNPTIRFFETSSKTGKGFDQWINWIIEGFGKFSE